MTAVQLLPADPAWPDQAASLMTELATCLPATAQLVHIGSTAVPGLCAKPVLDLMLGLPGLDLIDEAQVASLAALGYAHRPAYEAAIPERRYFVRAAGALPRVHLHAVVQGGRLWQQHLRVRDRLRAEPALRDAYAALKRALAAAHAQDKAAYTAAKAPFIAQLLAPGPGG